MHRRSFCAGVAAAALLVDTPAFAAAAKPAVHVAPGLEASNPRLGEHDGATRFVIDLSDSVEAHVEAVQNPPRLLIDLPAGSLQSSWLAPRGMVTGIRHGTLENGGLRLVLDLTDSGGVAASFMLPPTDTQKPRLVIDIEKAEPATFRSASLAGGDDIGELVARYSSNQAAAIPVSAVSAVPSAIVAPPPAGRSDGGRNGRGRGGSRQRLIVLDPGHGGKDPGAIGVNGLYEKTVVLAIAKRLQGLLQASGDYKVVMTRSDDTFIPLRERPAIAHRAKADLFIAIHADSVARGSARGASVYTLSDKASDRESAKLAEHENHTDAVAGIDVSAGEQDVFELLLSLSQRDTMNQSRGFATHLLGELDRDTRLLHAQYMSAGFAVLTAPDVPAVLVETGFMSSAEDAALLGTAAHQQKLAGSIKRAIDDWFGMRA